MRLDSCAIPYLMFQIFVALCYMSDQQTSLIQASAILVSQFEFYGPRLGDSFVQFCFLSHLFFSINISFVKCKYCSLVFFFIFC